MNSFAGSNREVLEARVASVPFWWHSIALREDVVTPGVQSVEWFEAQWDSFELGDLTGRSVLDIGAWDGFNSFAAERHGAARVLAVDHLSWSLDFEALAVYDGVHDPGLLEPHQMTGVWRPESLPGKRGFELAHDALGSGVESLVGDVMALSPAQIGAFDVVLFLGVLYHLKDPFGGMRRVAALTRDLAVIETAVMVVPGYEAVPLWRFIPDASFNNDITNWWVPNEAAVHAVCTAAGFVRVRTVVRPDPVPSIGEDGIGLGRLICHALMA